jgi:hypothetical protein
MLFVVMFGTIISFFLLFIAYCFLISWLIAQVPNEYEIADRMVEIASKKLVT